ncbi:MAG: hypothetical protein GY804_11680 [Alphaproteobacteria bacterium]|nr:hypothetical protein [Alphaproteobacteria bacterium]
MTDISDKDFAKLYTAIREAYGEHPEKWRMFMDVMDCVAGDADVEDTLENLYLD